MAENWIGMGELALLIGRDAADILCRAKGGVGFYVPVSPDTSAAEELRRLVGRTALAALCDAYGGLTVTVPNKRRGEPLKADIMTLLDRGVSAREIARRTGVTERYVRALAQQNKNRPGQLSLLS